MGIDIHVLNFLRYSALGVPLGSTATLGRQAVHVQESDLVSILGLGQLGSRGPYCEQLLKDHFGATEVVSFDASDYEGATYIHDFNVPLSHPRTYDSVLDFGTLEHIFNVPTALANIASLCRPGGRIMHVLPASNFNGHGFWQFSPELFFSLYRDANGFGETSIFLAELSDVNVWWRARRPSGDRRVEFTSPDRSYLLVSTIREASRTSQSVQQSDYVPLWEQAQPPLATDDRPKSAGTSFRRLLRRSPVLWRLGDLPLWSRPRPACYDERRLCMHNQGYIKERVSTLLRNG